jgi:hypothetical protein
MRLVIDESHHYMAILLSYFSLYIVDRKRVIYLYVFIQDVGVVEKVIVDILHYNIL